MPSNGMTDGTGISRRKWLQASVAGSAGLLAGCSGDGGDGDDTTTDTTTDEGDDTTTDEGDDTTTDTTETTTEKQVLDQAFRRGMGRSNMLEPEMAPQTAGYFYEYSTQLQGKGGRFCLGANRFIFFDYDGGPELDQGAGELRFSIKPGLKWHSGEQGIIDDFHAEDMVFKEQFNDLMTPNAELPDKPPVTGYYADGPQTFVLNLNTRTGYNDAQLINGFTQDYRFDHYRNGIYSDKFEALESASSSDERQQLRTEVLNMTATVNNKPLSGPWQVTDAAQQRISFERQEEHWLFQNNHVNFNGLVLKSIGGSGNAGYAACREDQQDTCSVPGTVSSDNAPDYIKQVVSSAGAGFGQGLIMAYGSPTPEVLWNDPVVSAKARQALAYGIDKEQAGKNELSVPEGAGRPPKAKFLDKQHLLQTTAMAQDVLGDDYENFPAYERSEEMVTQRLNEGGFTQDGGEWYTPSDNRFQFQINAPGWGADGAQSIVENLNDFGIDANMIRGSSFVSTYWGTQDYQSVIAETTPHSGPPSSFMSYWWDPSTSTIKPPGNEDRSADWSTYPVPPIGQMDAEPTNEVDTRQLVQRFATTPEDELTEDIKLLSWVNAYHVPCYALWLNASEIGLNTTHFSHPTPSPDFPDQWGNNYGIATGDHNGVYGEAQMRHAFYKGYADVGATGGMEDATPVMAKPDSPLNE